MGEPISVFRCPDFQHACHAAKVLALNCGCAVDISREYSEQTEEVTGWYVSLPTAAHQCMPLRHVQIICGEIEDEEGPVRPGFGVCRAFASIADSSRLLRRR